MTLSPPEPLADHHDIEAFASGVESLDTWLKRRAMKNQATGASRTFVACEGVRVMAYYALASSAITVDDASGRLGGKFSDTSKPVTEQFRKGAAAKKTGRQVTEAAEKGQLPGGDTEQQMLAGAT